MSAAFVSVVVVVVVVVVVIVVLNTFWLYVDSDNNVAVLLPIVRSLFLYFSFSPRDVSYSDCDLNQFQMLARSKHQFLLVYLIA